MLAPVGQFRLLPALDGGPLVLDRMTAISQMIPYLFCYSLGGIVLIVCRLSYTRPLHHPKGE